MITSTTICTYSGITLAPLAPRIDQVRLEDIAHALSLTCRFNGHIREFYSVAQHSVFVSHLCAPADALHGLLHDASEAYLADIVRPVKHSGQMAGYRAIEAQLQAVIFQAFGLRGEMPESVLAVDDLLLVTEAHELLAQVPEWAQGKPKADLRKRITCWPPRRAEAAFLERFRVLTLPGAQA